jgi:hypothetical protein
MSDDVKNASQLQIGSINEVFFGGIFLRVDHAPWQYFDWTTVLLFMSRCYTLLEHTIYTKWVDSVSATPMPVLCVRETLLG